MLDGIQRKMKRQQTKAKGNDTETDPGRYAGDELAAGLPLVLHKDPGSLSQVEANHRGEEAGEDMDDVLDPPLEELGERIDADVAVLACSNRGTHEAGPHYHLTHDRITPEKSPTKHIAQHHLGESKEDHGSEENHQEYGLNANEQTLKRAEKFHLLPPCC